MGGALFYKSTFLVSCTRMSHDPVEHTSNSTVTTCADGTTEHTENGGLGVNICCSSALALYQTGNNDGKRWNFPVVPLSERNSAGRTGQPRRAARRRGRWNIRVRFPSDDDDIPSLEREADFYFNYFKMILKLILSDRNLQFFG